MDKKAQAIRFEQLFVGFFILLGIVVFLITLPSWLNSCPEEPKDEFNIKSYFPELQNQSQQIQECEQKLNSNTTALYNYRIVFLIYNLSLLLIVLLLLNIFKGMFHFEFEIKNKILYPLSKIIKIILIKIKFILLGILIILFIGSLLFLLFPNILI